MNFLSVLKFFLGGDSRSSTLNTKSIAYALIGGELIGSQGFPEQKEPAKLKFGDLTVVMSIVWSHSWFL